MPRILCHRAKRFTDQSKGIEDFSRYYDAPQGQIVDAPGWISSSEEFKHGISNGSIEEIKKPIQVSVAHDIPKGSIPEPNTRKGKR